VRQRLLRGLVQPRNGARRGKSENLCNLAASTQREGGGVLQAVYVGFLLFAKELDERRFYADL